MQQPEAKFKRKLVEAFDQCFAAGWCAYMRALGKDGVPDLRFIVPTLGGLWIEAKAEAKPYSPVQRLQIGNMRAAGDRVIGLRVTGMDSPKSKRVLQIEIPDGPDFRSVLKVPWSAMSDRVFWSQLFILGAL